MGALLKLKLVQSVLAAMHNADAASAKFATDAAGVPIKSHAHGASTSIRPDPRFAFRQVIHPMPRYLPRQVIHPTPQIEPDPCPVGCHKTHSPCLPMAPQPPWKLLPWQDPAPPRALIKNIIHQPDTQGKGNLIDLFI